jgi:hypothetical protein
VRAVLLYIYVAPLVQSTRYGIAPQRLQQVVTYDGKRQA